jgi:hypothetical protein
MNYRRVNAVTQANEYPLPRQTDIFRALSGSKWSSTFVALSGFHQLEIVLLPAFHAPLLLIQPLSWIIYGASA